MTPKDVPPKVVHVWMPDRRSLCDRRARSQYPNHEDLTDDQFEAVVKEQEEAPVCGACIVVALHVRTKAAVLIAESIAGMRDVYPPLAADAYRSLEDTRWALEFDADPPDQLSDSGFYRDAIVESLTERWIANAAEEQAAETAEMSARLREGRRVFLEDQRADNSATEADE